MVFPSFVCEIIANTPYFGKGFSTGAEGFYVPKHKHAQRKSTLPRAQRKRENAGEKVRFLYRRSSHFPRMHKRSAGGVPPSSPWMAVPHVLYRLLCFFRQLSEFIHFLRESVCNIQSVPSAGRVQGPYFGWSVGQRPTKDPHCYSASFFSFRAAMAFSSQSLPSVKRHTM